MFLLSGRVLHPFMPLNQESRRLRWFVMLATWALALALILWHTATVREYVDPAIAGAATDPLKRYYNPSREVPLNAKPSVAAAGISRTRGVVYHALPWLSLTYNRSNNFSPVGNAAWKNF